ncbi:hypothetical protein HYE67_011311 [Fusarium culmorum]|uniref:F-box domain-containing protein n=1 Tax=Fusarium culmorum TaxID=5516 RepID=A0A7S8DI96_FUSCU|nr:hypothetical protein HYE67_011311 [Fusarium culmorum]
MSDSAQLPRWTAAPRTSSVPAEIRNAIYEFTLLDSRRVRIITGRDFRISTGLFRVNKTIHQEATQFLFSHKVFDFLECSLYHQRFFLRQISVRNASYIRHVIINFPEFFSLPINVALNRRSLGVLESISTSCTGLSTLRTSLGSTAYMESRLCDLFDGNRATEALQLVNTHFRAFPSRPEIILEVYEDAPSAFLRAIMKSQGWTLNINKSPIRVISWAS